MDVAKKGHCELGHFTCSKGLSKAYMLTPQDSDVGIYHKHANASVKNVFKNPDSGLLCHVMITLTK